ncbi:MAG: SLC13 family permease [Lawsonibacter sp.]|nr:SLC13 family permease [Lawsonibacter sp.]
MIAQITAVVIFLAMFALIIMEKIERHLITLGCGLLTLIFVFGICMRSKEAVLEALSLHIFFRLGFWYEVGAETVSSGINWETICFIAGMMIMVEGMADSGFFRWLCMAIAKLVRYQAVPIFITFMIISAVLSMFIDSITVIMFLAAVTVELAQMLKLDPIPMILSEIFCANLGGAATMCGDPPNIIIGTSLGYSFGDFVKNTGVIVAFSMIFVLLYFYLLFRKTLTSSAAAYRPSNQPNPKEAITDQKSFAVSCAIFGCAVALLITHAQTRLTVSCIGVFIALVTLIFSGKRAKQILLRLDYKTLLFFIGLFVVVSGLEQTGILEWIASLISKASGGNTMLVLVIIVWGSAVASAFIDNIPFAATMIHVIRSLSSVQGIELQTLAWALSMGTDIGGNATPIGASANVVGTSIAAKNGHPISWGTYCKTLVPPTIIVIMISMLFLFVRYV